MGEENRRLREENAKLLAQHEPHRIRVALWRFYDACAQANMRETTRLALTIETWWPAILVALTERVTNARTEGFIIWSVLLPVADVHHGGLEWRRGHVLWSVSLTSPT